MALWVLVKSLKVLALPFMASTSALWVLNFALCEPCLQIEGLGQVNITGEKGKLTLCYRVKKFRARTKTALFLTICTDDGQQITQAVTYRYERKPPVNCIARPEIPSGISFASAASPASSALAPAPNDSVSLANSQPNNHTQTNAKTFTDNARDLRDEKIKTSTKEATYENKAKQRQHSKYLIITKSQPDLNNFNNQIQSMSI